MTTIKEYKTMMEGATDAPWNCQDKTGKWLSAKSDWTADLNRDANGGVSSSVPIQKGLSKKTLALVVWEGWNDEEATTNAQFIAASRNIAPELIRVIELAEEALNSCEESGAHGEQAYFDEDMVRQALSEIRKLKGE